MLRKLTAIALTAAALGAAAQLKIAVLNVERALGDSDEAKALGEQIQADLQSDQDGLKALGEEIEAL